MIDPTSKPLLKVMQSMTERMGAPHHLILKKSGPYIQTRSDKIVLACPQATRIEQKLHTAINCENTMEGYKLRMELIHDQHEKGYYYMNIELLPHGKIDWNQLGQTMNEMEELMKSENSAEWQFMIEWEGKQKKQAISTYLEHDLRATQMDFYKDSSSALSAYYSEVLHKNLNTAESYANIQWVIHMDGYRNTERHILAYPMISSEF